MSDLARISNCWFSHAQAHFCLSKGVLDHPGYQSVLTDFAVHIGASKSVHIGASKCLTILGLVKTRFKLDGWSGNLNLK